MKLEYIEFCQDKGQPTEWKLVGCTFENINLLVGKNATGKTKILNVIGTLANLLSRRKKLPIRYGNYKVHFVEKGKKIIYSLIFDNEKVCKEELLVDRKSLMKRGSRGTGKIYSEQFDQHMDFKISADEVAAFIKRDSIQHPFLDNLYNWADNVIHFYFGTPLGKDKLIGFIKSDRKEIKVDLKKTDDVLLVFKKGKEIFKQKFISIIKKDMASIGYEIENIALTSPISFRIESTIPAAPLCLVVKEVELKGQTDQNDMSQGMFRALSLIVQINYANMAKVPSCILIDDIGEGLDFDRSTNLIKLIIDKAENKFVQLIMATNDRFIMNNVPLQYWSIINRLANKAVCINHSNSKELFDEFELTGLNNFDFFSSNYFLKDSNK